MSSLDDINILLNIYEVVKNYCGKVKAVCGCLWFVMKSPQTDSVIGFLIINGAATVAALPKSID